MEKIKLYKEPILKAEILNSVYRFSNTTITIDIAREVDTFIKRLKGLNISEGLKDKKRV